jgi:4'-phosphopantetheinyl transferase
VRHAARHPRHAVIVRDLAPSTGDAGILVVRRIPSPAALLWLIDMQASAAALKRHPSVAQRWLTRSDHRRLKRIRDHAEKARRAATYVALRIMIAGLLGKRFARAPMVRPLGGKPRLAGVPVSFNLTHSGDFALIGVGRRGKLGVDLEEVRDTLPMALKHRARIVDAARIIGAGRALDPEHDRDVLQAWTRLEAFSKATGRGINRTLADFGIRKQGNARLHTPGDGVAARARSQMPRYVVHDLRLPSRVIAALARDV